VIDCIIPFKKLFVQTSNFNLKPVKGSYITTVTDPFGNDIHQEIEIKEYVVNLKNL
jgi:hypothetical protein